MSVSTIGGNVAENSGGLRGLKYGTTKDYVMGMEVYANTGDLVRCTALKNAPRTCHSSFWWAVKALWPSPAR